MKNMEYRLRYLPLAKQDIDEIEQYLSRFYPSTVGRFFEELQHSMRLLQDSPDMGENYRQYRRLVVQKYLVFYKVNHEECLVDIYRILRGTVDIERHVSKK
jgi:addiction module toxin, RelE/StbE family